MGESWAAEGWWLVGGFGCCIQELPCNRQVQAAHQEARQKPLCGPDMNANAPISTPPLLASPWISE